MRMPPIGYEVKFAEFIRLCRDAKERGIGVVIVAYPGILGDTKEEIEESLYRLSEYGLRLQIAS